MVVFSDVPAQWTGGVKGGIGGKSIKKSCVGSQNHVYWDDTVAGRYEIKNPD